MQHPVKDTGQLAQAELGLDYYVSRWYDPLTGHFTQADTIVPEPGKASAFDRYAYVQNNPLKYNDPSGHKESGECGDGGGGKCRKNKKIVNPPKPPEPHCKVGDECNTQMETTSSTTTPFRFQINKLLAPGSTPTPKTLFEPWKTMIPTQGLRYDPYVPDNSPVPWEMDAEEPDYYSYSVSLVLFSGSVTYDRYKNVYLGSGLSYGKGLPVGITAAKGYILRGALISEKDTQKFLQDLSMGGVAALIVGKGQNYPYAGPVDHSDEDIFVGTPQIGVYMMFNFLIIDNHTYGY